MGSRVAVVVEVARIYFLSDVRLRCCLSVYCTCEKYATQLQDVVFFFPDVKHSRPYKYCKFMIVTSLYFRRVILRWPLMSVFRRNISLRSRRLIFILVCFHLWLICIER